MGGAADHRDRTIETYRFVTTHTNYFHQTGSQTQYGQKKLGYHSPTGQL